LSDGLKWLNFKILEEKIDGYSLQNIKGCKGKRVNFKILVVFTLGFYLDSINKTLASLNLKSFEMLHLAELIPWGLPIKMENGICLDVGGKGMQAFFVKNGKLDDFEYLKGGGWGFSNRLSDDLGLDETLSRELKEDYANQDLAPETEERVKSILEPEKNLLKKSLFELKKTEFLGGPVFFFGGSCPMEEIRGLFAREKIIYPMTFEQFAVSKEVAKMPQFTPCFLAVLYKEKNGKKDI